MASSAKAPDAPPCPTLVETQVVSLERSLDRVCEEEYEAVVAETTYIAKLLLTDAQAAAFHALLVQYFCRPSSTCLQRLVILHCLYALLYHHYPAVKGHELDDFKKGVSLIPTKVATHADFGELLSNILLICVHNNADVTGLLIKAIVASLRVSHTYSSYEICYTALSNVMEYGTLTGKQLDMVVGTMKEVHVYSPIAVRLLEQIAARYDVYRHRNVGTLRSLFEGFSRMRRREASEPVSARDTPRLSSARDRGPIYGLTVSTYTSPSVTLSQRQRSLRRLYGGTSMTSALDTLLKRYPVESLTKQTERHRRDFVGFLEYYEQDAGRLQPTQLFPFLCQVARLIDTAETPAGDAHIDLVGRWIDAIGECCNVAALDPSLVKSLAAVRRRLARRSFLD